MNNLENGKIKWGAVNELWLQVMLTYLSSATNVQRDNDNDAGLEGVSVKEIEENVS